MDVVKVEGFVADGYDRVRQVFQGLVDDGRETGAGVSVWKDGREVVRLGAGWADAGRSRPWRPDTLVQPYSPPKAFVTIAALVAVRDGALALDQPAPWTSGGRTPGPGGSRSSARSTCTRAPPPWRRSSPS